MVTEGQAVQVMRELLALVAPIVKGEITVSSVRGDPLLRVAAIRLDWETASSPRVVAVRSRLKAPVHSHAGFLTQQP